MVNVFAVPLFFVCFRECLETSIVVSILLSLLKQTLRDGETNQLTHKKLVRQVWYGVLAGLILVVIIGAGLIGAFYGLTKDVFRSFEDVWEGVFALLASIIIGLMGIALLRINKMREKWRARLTELLENKASTKSHPLGQRFKMWSERNAMFLLPFITVLREGLEAVVFIGGVGLSYPATAFPIPVITGLLAGCVLGFIVYKGGNHFALQWFLIISTCFLYLVAAGLFSRAIWLIQNYQWNKLVGGDASEVGSGPGSYDIRKSVWHVDCCNPQLNGGGGWGIFNALFGWTNSATYGSVIGYNMYWLAIIVTFLLLRYKEVKGHYPFLKKNTNAPERAGSDDQESLGSNDIEKHGVFQPKTTEPAKVTEVVETPK